MDRPTYLADGRQTRSSIDEQRRELGDYFLGSNESQKNIGDKLIKTVEGTDEDWEIVFEWFSENTCHNGHILPTES